MLRIQFSVLTSTPKRLTLVPLLLFVFSLTAHADFDAKYKAYSGDLDGNGYADLFLSRPADLVMVPLDDRIIPIPTRRAEHVILMQNANRMFTVNSAPSASELAMLRSWTQSQVQLTASDINVDGQQDLFIKNLASDPHFPAGTPDQIVYAAKSPAAATAVAVNQVMRDFFTQINGWTLDHDYFLKTAIDKHWYHYTGTLQTGWWVITYINTYYAYDNGKHFLDETDDPANLNNIPAYCGDYPANCRYQSGSWQVAGTYLANIQVIFEYEHFDQDALSFAQAVGSAYDTPNSSADPTQAEAILEARLGAPTGDTVAAVLAYPVPRPTLPPEVIPPPPIRKHPGPLPSPANDPNFYPKPQLKWKILGRITIWACVLICTDEGDPDEGKYAQWYQFGWEWALDDILSRPDPSAQVKAVIGEGEGNGVYARIPSAAAAWGALYFTFGIDPATGREAPFSSEPDPWPPAYIKFMWAMNEGWLVGLMGKQTLFYDIQLYGERTMRGKFYPCERRILQGYPLREERSWQGTAPFTGGSCEFID